MSEAIKVKIGQFPGKIKVVEMGKTCTVKDALEKAELSSKGYQIRLNNKELKETDVQLTNGDTILLVKAIRGNLWVSSYLLPFWFSKGSFFYLKNNCL
jgi:sulfur carrier protein ThiS